MRGIVADDPRLERDPACGRRGSIVLPATAAKSPALRGQNLAIDTNRSLEKPGWPSVAVAQGGYLILMLSRNLLASSAVQLVVLSQMTMPCQTRLPWTAIRWYAVT